MGSLVAAGDVELWVEQSGSGPDVVLLCGLGDTHDAWSHQVASFSARFRITVIDNRGTGRSTFPGGPFTVADMAADAARALDTLGIARAHVAGFSMGGAIAQELAIARPDLAASLILIGTWCRTTPYQHQLFESWKRSALSARSDEEFVRSLLLWVYSRRAYSDGSIETRVADALGAPHPQSTDAFVRTVQAIQNHDTADRLGELSVPTFVLGGEDDLICPPEVQGELAARIPGARLELLAGEAHQPFQEAPERFDEIVLAFLTQ